MSYEINPNILQDNFNFTRETSETICAPLEIEDYIPQPMENVSPPKWHLAHSSWFFEQFILVKYYENYPLFHTDFAFLFNSYYNHMGDRTNRADRGFMTRPTVAKVYEYRAHINKHINKLIESNPSQEILKLIEVGVHHEQQHQELLIYDIKYILGMQPTFPVYGNKYLIPENNNTEKFIKTEKGIYTIGADGSRFSYDNEQPQHQVYLEEFEISNKLVTQGDYLEFMNAGGYENFDLWHAEAWDFINTNNIKAPLYWHKQDKTWKQYTLNGLQPVKPNLPVHHLSFYEAFAYAEWKKMRLPTEFEWEVASKHFDWGTLWEWTQSAYLPYPRFTKAKGALGEYNGKFMLNQNVLKGSSVATTKGHKRNTYRNFFHASSRWIYSGLRLVKN
ncbi:MAG: ergothioneine biosynthesis protein EgtB [Flavobacteriaceae bacterium]